MLIGESKLGKRVSLLTYSKEEAEKLRGDLWVCPSCKSALILKNGKHLRTHFAHKSKVNCQAFSEGETEEHLRGKEILAEWCQEWGTSYEMEAYLPELKQRPDILIEGRVAIEFQCSSLTTRRLKERTEGYLSHGYQVIWIVGEHFFLKNNLTNRMRLFLEYSEEAGILFWQLSVNDKKLSCYYNLKQIILTGELIYLKKNLKKKRSPY